MRSFFYHMVTLGLVAVFIASGIDALAQVRSSSNYQLQSDSLNVGGGLSTSTNFSQESTVGEIATGVGTSSNYELRAGYQQMQEVFISMTAAADVVMSPDLPGLTGGTSNGSTSVTVTTDSPSGYSLSIVSENNPAMQSGLNSISDHPATSSPAFDFIVPTGQAYFGYSVTSPDVVLAFRDNDNDSCGVGAFNNPGTCWAGLSTTSRVIAEDTDSNHPNGATTTVLFRVGLGGNNSVLSGVYTATTTLTALPL